MRACFILFLLHHSALSLPSLPSLPPLILSSPSSSVPSNLPPHKGTTVPRLSSSPQQREEPALTGAAGLRGGGRSSAPPAPPRRRRRLPQSLLSLSSLWHSLPTLPKFFVSGTIGNIIFFNLDLLLTSSLLPPSPSPTSKSLAFALAYLLQLPVQHLLNALLVYRLSSILSPTPRHPSQRSRYLFTLFQTYRIYGMAVVLSTAVKAGVYGLGGSEFYSFVVAIYGVGAVNYWLLGRAMER